MVITYTYQHQMPLIAQQQIVKISQFFCMYCTCFKCKAKLIETPVSARIVKCSNCSLAQKISKAPK